MGQANPSYASTKKATIHYLGENLYEDKTPNNMDKTTIEFDEPKSLEEIWFYCQNFHEAYASIGTRSLMVGDVIETEAGEKFQIKNMGFEIIN